jgi:hypothetical protein
MDICRQAKLQLYTTLSIMRNYNHDNTLDASVIADFISPPLELTRKLAFFLELARKLASFGSR